MTKTKNNLSRERQKFQKEYIQQIINDKSIYHLLDDYKKMMNIKLNKYSDNEFIELIKDESFTGNGVWHISQWVDYQNFVNYVKENK